MPIVITRPVGIPTSHQRLSWGRLRRLLRERHANAVAFCHICRCAGLQVPRPEAPRYSRGTSHLAYTARG